MFSKEEIKRVCQKDFVTVDLLKKKPLVVDKPIDKIATEIFNAETVFTPLVTYGLSKEGVKSLKMRYNFRN